MITRRDLPPGLQAAQAVHGAFEVASSCDSVQRWLDVSNYLVILSAADEADLQALAGRMRSAGIYVCEVHEPDLDNELTCLVVLPHPENRRFLSAYPLALKEAAMVT